MNPVKRWSGPCIVIVSIMIVRFPSKWERDSVACIALLYCKEKVAVWSWCRNGDWLVVSESVCEDLVPCGLSV